MSAPQDGQLSVVESEIARAFAEGETYQQIADRLCLAPSTVRAHFTTVYRKLGVSSKLDLHKIFRIQRQNPRPAAAAAP